MTLTSLLKILLKIILFCYCIAQSNGKNKVEKNIKIEKTKFTKKYVFNTMSLNSSYDKFYMDNKGHCYFTFAFISNFLSFPATKKFIFILFLVHGRLIFDHG